jgi:plastocyanin
MNYLRAKRLNLLTTTVGILALAPMLANAASVQVEIQDANGKPLPDAVVFLESREAKALAKPMQGVEIAQVSKQFVPMVSVVTAGTSVQFPNRDTVRHHVYSFSPIKTFDLKLYTGTPANPVLFDRTGIAVLGCNIHDSMAAWVVVVETPYFGRTSNSGRLTLDNVPPGNYRLRTWHPDLPPGAPAADQALALTNTSTSVTVKWTGSRP